MIDAEVPVTVLVPAWILGRVNVPFVGGYGACTQCRTGHHQVCPISSSPALQTWGASVEFVKIDLADENLVCHPD